MPLQSLTQAPELQQTLVCKSSPGTPLDTLCPLALEQGLVTAEGCPVQGTERDS